MSKICSMTISFNQGQNKQHFTQNQNIYKNYFNPIHFSFSLFVHAFALNLKFSYSTFGLFLITIMQYFPITTGVVHHVVSGLRSISGFYLSCLWSCLGDTIFLFSMLLFASFRRYFSRVSRILPQTLLKFSS